MRHSQRQSNPIQSNSTIATRCYPNVTSRHVTHRPPRRSDVSTLWRSFWQSAAHRAAQLALSLFPALAQPTMPIYPLFCLFLIWGKNKKNKKNKKELRGNSHAKQSPKQKQKIVPRHNYTQPPPPPPDLARAVIRHRKEIKNLEKQPARVPPHPLAIKLKIKIQ